MEPMTSRFSTRTFGLLNGLLLTGNFEVIKSFFATNNEKRRKSRPENACYMKLVVKKSTDVVVGFHYLGPNAGEVTQVQNDFSLVTERRHS
jgi:pyruvate/2-oxoglutarate dehydrogenase complex dihydrolipoamide dehydrogenase (E3) component